MGTLYVVATPIGNLQDITLRAIEVLKSVEYIACEDTRKTGILLKSLDIGHRRMLISYYEQTEETRIPNILNLLINGEDVALVSDSGTPLISDPGFRLVREAIKNGIKVFSIPGASSVISSLVSSGLPTDKFMFLGFLPKKQGHRLKLLKDIKETTKFISQTVIIFESPFRLTKTLEELQNAFGDIEIVIARELTKIHEELKRGSITQVLSYFKAKNVKGEVVILFNLK